MSYGYDNGEGGGHDVGAEGGDVVLLYAFAYRDGGEFLEEELEIGDLDCVFLVEDFSSFAEAAAGTDERDIGGGKGVGCFSDGLDNRFDCFLGNRFLGGGNKFFG